MAQWKSVPFTPGRSLVRSQLGPLFCFWGSPRRRPPSSALSGQRAQVWGIPAGVMASLCVGGRSLRWGEAAHHLSSCGICHVMDRVGTIVRGSPTAVIEPDALGYCRVPAAGGGDRGDAELRCRLSLIHVLNRGWWLGGTASAPYLSWKHNNAVSARRRMVYAQNPGTHSPALAG